MQKLLIFALSTLISFGPSILKAEQTLAPVSEKLYLFQYGRLELLKKAVAEKDSLSTAGKFAKEILHEADQALTWPVFTIVNNKVKGSMGAPNPHDYFSTAPYYWPDPKKPNGLPYIRRDGERNPARKAISDEYQERGMLDAVVNLSISYRITGEEKYAASATKFLRAFFLDSKTRMNPNMNHAQAVPGENTGRGIGIIDTLGFHELTDSITLLAPSKAWDSRDRSGMKQWFRQYAQWMMSSKNGKAERAALNNHGITYDLQLVSVLLASGNIEEATNILAISLPARMDSQIRNDGQMPLEEERKTSWHYCSMNLKYLCRNALVAQNLGINLWNHEAPDGTGSIKKAMLFLIPFIDHREKWKFSEISTFSSQSTVSWLSIGSLVYNDAIIKEAQQTYAPMEKLTPSEWIILPLK
jgi:hypothetical protein